MCLTIYLYKAHILVIVFFIYYYEACNKTLRDVHIRRQLGVCGSPHVGPSTRRRVRHVGISPIAHVAQQNTAEVEARALRFLAIAHIVLSADIHKRIFPLLPLSLLRLSLLRLGLDGWLRRGQLYLGSSSHK